MHLLRYITNGPEGALRGLHQMKRTRYMLQDLKSNTLCILTCLFVVLLSGITSAQIQDEENCLLCHRYPTMGRYDEKGNKKISYISEEEFAKSDHGRLQCSGCHVGLDRIPHPENLKVDCTINCHVTNLSTNNIFSHRDMAQKYDLSVHGLGREGIVQNFPDDLPICKDCHDNHIYTSSGKDRTRRSQKEIVELCTRCHKEREKMARHGLDPIDTFKDSFHWELAKYGVKDAPDCISCHVPAGYSSHDIRPGNDPLSPINTANRVQTCSNKGGTQTCHPDATAGFASGRVHAYEFKAQLTSGESAFDVEGRFNILMEERTKANITGEEIFHYKILYLLKLFYKILIAVTISFMGIHQILDYRKARKKHGTPH